MPYYKQFIFNKLNRKFFSFGRIFLFCLLSGVVFFILIPLPSFKAGTAYSTVLEAKDGRLMGARIAEDGQWRFPPHDAVPEKFRHAIMLFEDEYFYSHPGINPASFLRALRENYKAGKVVQGGSTLTMQLIRMARGNRPRTVFEKLTESLLALKTEIFYSKEEILSLYAAHAPFGGNVVGLQAAAWRYYGRPPEKLSWAEYATLAVLPNSPSLIYPGKNSPRLLAKRNRLLDKLHDKGFIEEADRALAKAEPLPGKPKPLPDLASRLLNRVVQEGRAGQKIRTTLDLTLQVKVKQKVERAHQALKDNHVYNAAAVVIDIETGHALAYVGNTEAGGEHGQHVDIITSHRSPGSILKPFLYAAALEDGLILPRQLLPDVPMFYQGFAPNNFDKKFHGAVPADQALARSLNVPFVYLLREYGYEKFHQRLKNIGINSLNKPAGHYGLSLILGGAEASLWDITAAYAGMARSLLRYNKRPLGRQYAGSDYHSNYYLPETAEKETEELSASGIYSVHAVSRMLQAMQELNRPEEQAGWEFYSSAHKTAWKTGTSYGFKDAWAVGITATHVVGVWIGNADGEGRPGLTGVKAAAPLMFDILQLLPQDKTFPLPYNSSLLKICRQSGYKAGPWCEEAMEVPMPAISERAPACPFHKLLHLDAAGQYQVNSSCYPVNGMLQKSWFILPAAEAWYYKKYQSSYTEPPEFLPLCTSTAAAEIPFVELIYPRNFTRLYIPAELDGTPGAAVFEVAHRNPSSEIYWHLDEEYLGKTSGKHQFALHPAKGKHTLVLLDEQGRELNLNFEVISDRKGK